MPDIEAERLRLVGKLCSIRKADTPERRDSMLIGIVAEVREPPSWSTASPSEVEVRFEGKSSWNYFGAMNWVIDVWGEP